MQRTATRCVTTFSMIKHFHFDWRSLPIAVADLILVRSMRAMCIAGLACSIAISTSFGGIKLPPSIEVWSETVGQFQRSGKDFRRAIARAVQEGDVGIRDFIHDCRFTDAAGGLGYGVALIGIAEHVGDKRFSRVAASLEHKDKEKVWLFLRVGAEYRRQPISDTELARRLPKTCEALQKT
jgi:hypothetical protein